MGTQATDIGVGTVALCEGLIAFVWPPIIDDFPGWLSFIGTEVVWNPLRGPQYRGHLLPWEQQICDTLSISADEYFEYYELVCQHRKEEQGRELIPDIRNETETVIAIVSLVVGLRINGGALFLLTPKPRSPNSKSRAIRFKPATSEGAPSTHP